MEYYRRSLVKLSPINGGDKYVSKASHKLKHVCILIQISFVFTEFCRLTQDEVLQRLSYLPLNGILGTSVASGEEVNYGLNMKHGDVLEEGTVVKGHCYEW